MQSVGDNVEYFHLLRCLAAHDIVLIRPNRCLQMIVFLTVVRINLVGVVVLAVVM